MTRASRRAITAVGSCCLFVRNDTGTISRQIGAVFLFFILRQQAAK